MAKFRKADRQLVKALVRDCVIAKFSELQSLDYIEDRTHVRISSRWLRKVKEQINNDALDQIQDLKKGAFVLEAHQRIVELKQNYQNLIVLKVEAGKIKDRPLKVKALLDIENSLINNTKELAAMYDALPFVAAVQTRLKKEDDSEILKPA